MKIGTKLKKKKNELGIKLTSMFSVLQMVRFGVNHPNDRAISLGTFGLFKFSLDLVSVQVLGVMGLRLHVFLTVKKKITFKLSLINWRKKLNGNDYRLWRLFFYFF